MHIDQLPLQMLPNYSKSQKPFQVLRLIFVTDKISKDHQKVQLKKKINLLFFRVPILLNQLLVCYKLSLHCRSVNFY